MLWELLLLFGLTISFFLIPFQIAFLKSADGILFGIFYLIDLIFILDIFIGFHSSYREDGQEITDTQKTSRHYLRKHFIIDILSNFPFDLFLIFSLDLAVNGIPLIILFRLNRILRISRLFRIFHAWEEHSWTNSGYLRIGKFFTIIILLVHWIACIWFLIPFIENLPAKSWVILSGILDAPVASQYIRSLYWTIVTTTTVGYGDIIPHTDLEHVLTMIVIVMGASIYAFMIGNIASIISKLDYAKVQYWNKIESINKYLRYKNVPAKLNEQVRNYYDYIWAKHRGLQENSFLDDLPRPMKLEIMSELTGDLTKTVPLFNLCSPALMNELLLSLKVETYPPDNIVAGEGEVGNDIFFISKGELEINSAANKRSYGLLKEGEYFGDTSLIFNDKRTASVVTKSFCEILILGRNDFNRLKQNFSEFKEVLKKVSSERSEKMTELVLEGIVL